MAADIKAAGGEAVLARATSPSKPTSSASSRDATAAFGRIDVLINNAGGMLGRVKIEDYTVEHIQRVLALNCTQVALFMREVDARRCASRSPAT